MDGKHVKLSTPVEAFGKQYSELTLREPRASLYARLGEPRIAVMNGGQGGGGYFLDVHDTIRNYLEALIDIGDAATAQSILAQLSLPDYLKLKNALLSFFLEAAALASTAP